MTKCFVLLRKWLLACALLTLTNAAIAANGCSPYSNYGGNTGKVWFNEYYFGPATDNYLEIFSKNLNVKDVNSDIWSKWYIGVYSSKGPIYYSLASNTTACTVSGGRTYITRTGGLDLNYNDAMVVVFDGYPTFSTTREIDAFVYSNASPPTPYPGNTRFNYYTPTCSALKTTMDQQATQSTAQTPFRGQNILILSNFGNKDNARLPDGIGNWDETSLTGSGTSFTQCVTNDPVDLTKSFTWAPKYTTPTYAGTVDPEAVVTFTITARNATRASMTGVRVSDTLPAGLTLTGTPTASAGSLVSCSGSPTTCVLSAPSSLLPDTAASMTFQALVGSAYAGATIQNTAVQTAGTMLNPAPTADALLTVASGLTLSLAADKGAANYGERVTFTVTAYNATNYPMAGTQVTIPFPTGLPYYGGYVPQVTAGTVVCDATSCVWTLPATLAAGAAPTLTFQATATGSPGQTMTLTAEQTQGSTLSTKPSSSATVTMASVAVAGFNACHNFSASNCSRTGGRLWTRRAGVVFTTDIVALKADGTLETAYVGSGGTAKTLRVDLINVANANTVVATQNVTFPAGDTTGRVVASWGGLSSAYTNLQVRISETTGASPTTSLSNDSFAVRPSGLTITTSASATANSTTSTPAIKAGTPFTVSATATPATGYAGTASVDLARLTTGNVQVGKLYTAGTTNVLALTVNGAAASATYDEVGYFYAQPGAFRDEAFTAIDRNSPPGCDPASTCDCISAGSESNTLSDELVGSTGRYGCFIGNMSEVPFARFIPHHFAVKATPSFTPGHAACSFTYMDQPFTLSAVIEARNAGGNRTVNYHGDYAKGNVSVQLENADNGTPIPATRLVRTDSNTWTNGSFTMSANRFTRPGSPDGPYDALAIGVSVTDEVVLGTSRPMLIDRDMDSATTGCTKDTAGTSNGSCTAVNVLTTASKASSMRFGRLRLSNMHGSELLPLPIPMRLEYFTGNSGWATNTLDSCTNIDAANVALQNYVPPAFSSSMPASNVSIPVKSGTQKIFQGEGTIRLARPNPAPTNRSSVDVCVDLGPDTASTTAGVVAPVCSAAASANMPWLQGRWSETKYDDDPVIRATFGVYKSGPIIYRREMY